MGKWEREPKASLLFNYNRCFWQLFATSKHITLIKALQKKKTCWFFPISLKAHSFLILTKVNNLYRYIYIKLKFCQYIAQNCPKFCMYTFQAKLWKKTPPMKFPSLCFLTVRTNFILNWHKNGWCIFMKFRI